MRIVRKTGWLLALLLGAGSGHAQPAAGPYVHVPSGMIFPATAGAFKRLRVTRGQGNDLSSGYMDLDPTARLSAIVFIEQAPLPPDASALCRAMAQTDRDGVTSKHADARFADLMPPAALGHAAVGFSSRYADDKDGAVDVYLSCEAPWLVEYRFEHAGAFDAAALEADFLQKMKPPEPQKH